MDFNNKKALIVDDEIDLARVLSMALKQAGLENEMVHSIDSAIEKINNNSYDIIISDIYLPHKTGKDLFEYVIGKKITIPFIFMTGNPDVQMAVNFLQKGGYDYIVKPFNITDFLDKVKNVIQKHEENIQKEEAVDHLRDVLNERMQELKIYKDIYQSMNDIILITDTAGKIVTSNEALFDLSGLKESEAKEKTPEILLPESNAEENFLEIMSKLKTEGKWEGELKGVNKGNEQWDALVNVISVKDENNDTFAFGWQFKDITLLRKTQAQMLEFFGQMNQAQEAIIFGLAKLAEYRDKDTGFHLERMRAYARLLAKKLSVLPRYKDIVNEEYIENIYKTSPLHDIGKVGISDSILHKKGKLTKEEFDIIKQHTIIGAQTLKSIKTQYGEMAFINMGIDIALYHHEKWDGSGYPEGLKGGEIPLAARITAIADVYDALTSKRVYKEQYSHEKAMSIMMSEHNKHFDPDLLEIFNAHSDEVANVKEQYSDLSKK